MVLIVIAGHGSLLRSMFTIQTKKGNGPVRSHSGRTVWGGVELGLVKPDVGEVRNLLPKWDRTRGAVSSFPFPAFPVAPAKQLTMLSPSQKHNYCIAPRAFAITRCSSAQIRPEVGASGHIGSEWTGGLAILFFDSQPFISRLIPHYSAAVAPFRSLHCHISLLFHSIVSFPPIHISGPRRDPFASSVSSCSVI